MFEATVRVPAIVWGRGIPAMRRDELVALFDWGPTILEWAGVAPPAWMEAQSLNPLMAGEEQPRDRVFAEHANDAILTGTSYMTMIRRGDWKLVHFVDSSEGQLFDLAADPGERSNLWDDPAQAERKLRLEWRVLYVCMYAYIYVCMYVCITFKHTRTHLLIYLLASH